jgi:hypothetical protein
MALHDLVIFVKQRFAFRAVGEEVFDLGLGLDVRGESGSPGADDAGFAQPLTEHEDNIIAKAKRGLPQGVSGALADEPACRSVPIERLLSV